MDFSVRSSPGKFCSPKGIENRLAGSSSTAMQEAVSAAGVQMDVSEFLCERLHIGATGFPAQRSQPVFGL